MDRISLLLVLNEAIDALGDIPADKCTEQQREAYRRCVEVRGEIVKIDFLKGWKMENLLKYCILVICLATTIWINGCALGSASAAYAVRAQTAESLTAEAENRLVERIADRVAKEAKE